MKCKRILSAITAIVICVTLCGCQPKNSGTGVAEVTVSETVLSDKEDSSTTETNGEMSELSEASFAFKAPDKAFLKDCIDKSEEPYVYIKYCQNGTYEAADYDMINGIIRYISSGGEALLGENDDYSKYFNGANKLFDEKWNYVGEPAVYFAFGCKMYDETSMETDPDEFVLDKERTLEAAEYLFSVIEEDKEIWAAVEKAVSSGVLYVGEASYSGENDVYWGIGDITRLSEGYEFEGKYSKKKDDKQSAEVSESRLPVPDKDFVRNAVESCEGGYLIFRLEKDGSYSVLNDEEMNSLLYGNYDYEYIEIMLDEEYYNELSDEGILEEQGIESYEDYEKYVLSEFGYESLEDAKSGREPAFYLMTVVTDEYRSVDKQADSRVRAAAADCLISKFSYNPEISAEASSALERGESYCGGSMASASDNGIINVEICFDTMENFKKGNDPDEAAFYYREKLSVDGREGFTFGNSFVPADTEYLFLSSRDESTAKFLYSGDFPENACICAAETNEYDDVDDVTYDLKQLHEKLPNLKGLYMLQATVKNSQYLTEFSELSELDYYPAFFDEDGTLSDETIRLPDFGKLKNLKKLRILVDCDDYGFLKDLENVESVAIEIENVMTGQLEDIFACPAVTELIIDGCANDDYPDFSGITALTGLKKLEIDVKNVDFAQISELASLEEFSVRVYSGVRNAEQLGKLKNVSVLFLDSVECDDYGFLAEMDGLRDLSLSCMYDISNSDIEKLTKLEKLSLVNGNGVDCLVIEKLPKLKSIFFDGGGSADISQVSGSQSLEEFCQLFGSAESYDFFKNCPNIRTVALLGVNGVPLDMSIFVGTGIENIQCNGTQFENLTALAEVKTLKTLSLSNILEEDEDIIYLKEALPDCEIDCAEQAFTNMVD